MYTPFVQFVVSGAKPLTFPSWGIMMGNGLYRLRPAALAAAEKAHRNRKGMVISMKIFIDTANVAEIREANDLGVICGVTTNPSLIAKEGRNFQEVVTEIVSIVDGPISAEVISLEHDKMVEEAVELAKIHKNIVIKIPMCAEGLKLSLIHI